MFSVVGGHQQPSAWNLRSLKKTLLEKAQSTFLKVCVPFIVGFGKSPKVSWCGRLPS
jgi:hypothetical protein